MTRNERLRPLPLGSVYCGPDPSNPDHTVEFFLAQHHAEHLVGAEPDQACDMAVDYVNRMDKFRDEQRGWTS
ncbi:hypothetical protein ACFORH_43340 [Amycolatopsis roodepoortensis]|uniref:Uncharacterized protein n=1 Tax=Amycolatopsis roodepoortensis TaxID=700274 RepID=A0ABR9LJP1_9PSEU|nr:hypothetical protein [Amycolatopsis roodepoortensis]MBE1580423.1 hypothetical protein [Amycolatopsis roodepoortensis]